MNSSFYNKIFYTRIFNKEPEGYYRMQRNKIRIILDMFEKHENGRILDIGCGDGFISKLIAEKTGGEIHGIDISRDSLKKARSLGMKTKVLDVEQKKIPYRSEYFDSIFCGDVLEHIFDTEGLLLEINRVLKENGYTVISVPNIASWYNRLFLLIGWMPVWIESSSKTYTGNPFLKEGLGHIHAFTKKSLIDLLSINGFNIEKIKGSPLLGNGTHSKTKERVWNKVDTFFSKKPSLSSTIVLKARKNKNL